MHPAFADPDAAVDVRELGGILTIRRDGSAPLWCVLNTTDEATAVPLPVAPDVHVGLLSWSESDVMWNEGFLHLPPESAGWVG